MNVVALDAYEVAKELRAAGFTEAQAEAVTRAVGRAQDIDPSNLSTKSDLEAHRAAIKADLEAQRAATKADIDGVRHKVELLRRDTRSDIQALRTDIQASKWDTLKWVIGIVGFQTIAIIGTHITLTRGLR